VHKLVEATDISHDPVISILHEQLDIKKLSARWVPRLLTVNHKRNRITISKQCLEMFLRNPDEFLHRFTLLWMKHGSITSPETKEQSKQWTSPGEPTPKKVKTVKSAGKMITTVFWNARCIIHILYLSSKRLVAITMQPYWSVLTTF